MFVGDKFNFSDPHLVVDGDDEGDNDPKASPNPMKNGSLLYRTKEERKKGEKKKKERKRRKKKKEKRKSKSKR